jgi:purine nucleosidase
MAAESLKVVLDCDTGVDDAMAILYGLLAPEIEVVALGCVWGNAPVEVCTANTLRLLELVGQPGIPVAMGLGAPIMGPLTHVSTEVHGEDGQGNVGLPPPTLRPSGESAAAQLIRLAHERPEELTLVAVGPLTNVAAAVMADRRIARLYRQVVIMGGAFFTPGNVTRVAGANGWHDPEAAQIVYEAGWPILTVPLDVTHQVCVTAELLDRLRDSGTPAGVHVHRITQHYLDFYGRTFPDQRQCSMHDALALAIAADRSLIRRSRRARVDIELTGTLTRGMTVGDFRPWARPEDANAEVVFEAESERFLERWMAVLSGREPPAST